MNWPVKDGFVNRSIPATAEASATEDAITAQNVIAGLSVNAFDEYGRPIDFSRTNKVRGDALSVAWQRKDVDALAVWADPSMGKVFRWACEWNTMGSDYLPRAVEINVDSSLWHQLLVKEGKINPLPAEWRKAIEVASLVMDIGDDGLGGEGFKQALAGAGVMGPALAARVAALCGRIGSGGLYTEHILDGSDKAKKYMLALATSSTNANPSSFASKRGGIAAISDAQAHQEAIAELSASPWLDTKLGRQQFATALHLVKLADNSRGRAYSAVKSNGSIATLVNDSRYLRVQPNFDAALKASV